ncbi:MAG: hypothetical protein IPJ88_18740 [Myxococcales bacterium]|nr:MAG: hypothetical protein IPJ88_18740 [Myxococcales bacterium]
MIRKLFVLSLLVCALGWVSACDDDTTSTDASVDVATDTTTDSTVGDGNVTGDSDVGDAN